MLRIEAYAESYGLMRSVCAALASMNALCADCTEDPFLRRLTESEGRSARCTQCKRRRRKAFTAEELGARLEPVMRERFVQGDYGFEGEQQGDSMEYLIGVALGQDVDFVDDLVEAVIDADDYWPPDGGEPYWDASMNYVERRGEPHRFHAMWQSAVNDLRHNQRFFSASAQTLFSRLFEGVDDLEISGQGKRKRKPVRTLKRGTVLHRARVYRTQEELDEIGADPMAKVGPPPVHLATAGRMNAAGVVVFYGATKADTALAEVRPAIGNQTALIQVRTRSSLRLLDFKRLEEVPDVARVSFFDPDREEKLERGSFLRQLHRMISAPVVPGKEGDYLITQVMAEFLAHVYNPPFNGVLFESSQRPNGVNLVLFAESMALTAGDAGAFGIEYVDQSLKIYSTTAVRYTRDEWEHTVGMDGKIMLLGEKSRHLMDDLDF